MKKTLYLLIVICSFSFYYSFNNNKSSLKSYKINYRQIDLIDNDFNYDEIKKVSDWLKKNLSKENGAYMIVHNNEK